MTSPETPDAATTTFAVHTEEPRESGPRAEPDVAVAPTEPVPAEPATALAETLTSAHTAPARSVAPDVVLAAAVALAHEAALAVGGESVGEHIGIRAEGDRVVTHAFAATLPGYDGWHWAVTVARASRSRAATVDEVVLLPGIGALLAPVWVPWDERVRPGDLSPGDLLPPALDDPRLVPAYLLSDDPAVEAVTFELGVGREEVMSRDGRLLAAERWHTGNRGPDTAMARQAPAQCGTCGFFLPLAGSLQAGFGVCGNEVTDCDGQVVSVEYGCGAHSQTRLDPGPLIEVGEVVFDDGEEVTAN